MSEEQAQDSGQQPQYLDIKQVDHETLQKDFEAGILSLRELSRKFGLDPKKGHVQIKRLADKEGWEQDLNAKIQAKAEAKLRRKALPEEKQAAPRVADKLVIEANAEVIVQVRSRHRRDIGRAMVLSAKLMDELEHNTDNLDLLEQLGTLMFNPDEKGKDKHNEIYHAVISLPERTKTMKALSETLKNLIGLEREAYNITDGAAGKEAADALKAMTDAERAVRLAALLNNVRARVAQEDGAEA